MTAIRLEATNVAIRAVFHQGEPNWSTTMPTPAPTKTAPPCLVGNLSTIPSSTEMNPSLRYLGRDGFEDIFVPGLWDSQGSSFSDRPEVAVTENIGHQDRRRRAAGR